MWGEFMENKVLKVNKNKSGSGSISNRIIIPASWAKDMEIKDNIKAYYDKENKKIVIYKD